MANISYGVNILPKINNTYTLGNSDYKWNIYANSLNGINLSNIITDVQINNTSILNNNIANIPVADRTNLGTVKIDDAYGIWKTNHNVIYIKAANSSEIKRGNAGYFPIVPETQHKSIFYGLSKLAGVDLAQDSEVVLGTYPSTSKVAICSLIGAAPTDNPVFTGSISLGRKANTTVGNRSFAIGINVEASGDYSYAEGTSAKATGACSHAEGANTKATYSYSHAEGYYANALATGAHAEGYQTSAEGSYSHAEGYCTYAYGNYAHAEGHYTIAKGLASHVGGKYNVADNINSWPDWVANTNYTIGDRVKFLENPYECIESNTDSSFMASKWRLAPELNYVEIIGNGTSSNARSNARALDWKGNEYLMGDVYVGCNADSTGGTKLEPFPTVTSTDNGKFLRVVNGVWAAATVPSASEVSF